MKEAAGLARKQTAGATSLGSPMRPISALFTPAHIAGGYESEMSVRMKPAETELTSMAGANCFASATVRLMTPAFEALYGATNGEVMEACPRIELMFTIRPYSAPTIAGNTA